MKFMAVKNNDIGILYMVAVQDSGGHIVFLAYNYTVEDVFRHFLGLGRVVVEKRADDRTIHKQEFKTGDPGYFEALKMKLPPPYVPYVSGEMPDQDPQEALLKLWKMFSTREPRQVIEVIDAQKTGFPH